MSLPFPDGIGGRVLRNAFTDTWHRREAEVLAQRTALRAQLEAAAEVADADMEAVRAGAAAELIQSVESAGEIVRRIVAETERLLRERPSQVLQRRRCGRGAPGDVHAHGSRSGKARVTAVTAMPGEVQHSAMTLRP